MFNLYLAGSYSSDVEQKIMQLGVNRLASQLNDRNLLGKWIEFQKEGNKRKLFIDSGAFSAHTKGRELDVDEYIQYLNDRQGMFEVIAQVDKIPGEFGKPKTLEQLLEAPEQSWQNYLYMRERVIDKDRLTPIFHQGEDFKYLKRMLETTFDGEHIPYIGISPANDLNTKVKMEWFELVFKIIRDSSNPNVKTHAFGMTSLKVLERYPFYSADSTSWLMTSINGSIMTTKGIVTISEMQVSNPKHYDYFPKKLKDELTAELAQYGIDINDCRTDYKARSYSNACFLFNWAKNYKYTGTGRYQRRLF